MRFSIREWRRLYDKTHELGKILRDGRPTYDALLNYIPPVNELSISDQMELESQIKTLSERSNRYLDQTGMRKPKPLWKYNRKDKSTHASHSTFRYGYLLAAEE